MDGHIFAYIIDKVAESDIVELAISDGETFQFVYTSPNHLLKQSRFQLHAPVDTCEWTSKLLKEHRPIRQIIQHQHAKESLQIETSYVNESKQQTISIIRKVAHTHGSITVKMDDRWIPIPFDEVIYLEAHDRKTHVVSTDQTRGIHRLNLKELENELAKEQFIRCHRSFIVNIKQVKEIHPDSHATFLLIMTNQERIPVSQNYTRTIRDIFGF